MTDQEKVIIVEGKSDKKKISGIIKEPIEIVCTNGTIGLTKLDELLDFLENKQVYILADADEAGEKLRKHFKRELPEARHLFIDKMYREVATAPEKHLAEVLIRANIDVKKEYLQKG
jgi:toprim domain protein